MNSGARDSRALRRIGLGTWTPVSQERGDWANQRGLRPRLLSPEKVLELDREEGGRGVPDSWILRVEGAGGKAGIPETLVMGGRWVQDCWFSRKERANKDPLIWRCGMSRFLRRQNRVLTPASLTLIIYPRPGQTRSAGTAVMSLCQSGPRQSGRRLRCPAWYPRIMAPTPARRRTSTATRGRYMCSWSTVRTRGGRPGGRAQGRGGASRDLRTVLCGTGPWERAGWIGWCLRPRPVQRMIPGGQKPTEFL